MSFATGPSKKRSLVAVSTGLLDVMKKDEVEGVIAAAFTERLTDQLGDLVANRQTNTVPFG